MRHINRENLFLYKKYIFTKTRQRDLSDFNGQSVKVFNNINNDP